MQHGKVKKLPMKKVNIDEENLHIFWITWGMWMKFSGKSAPCDNIKSCKDQELYFHSKKFSFKKATGDANGGKRGKYREDKGR